VVVEAKTGNYYSMTFFPKNTLSNDGKKVIDVCRRIEEEFNILCCSEDSDSGLQFFVPNPL
jgi:hypothetical protein